MTNDQTATLIHAINHFGVEHQIKKCVEEMGELITELARRRTTREDRDRIALEVADVLITANQLRIIYGAQLVDQNIDNQLQRLEDEIDGDWRRQARMHPEVYRRMMRRSESTNENG